ncbi:fatty acid-binding protein homolog 7-like [Dreissena polymorpha]|nr:fatty acid-binding protein homolog 7-like [Dreissena polymorpha]
MTSNQYEEIQKKFSGTWRVDRNELFEEFLAEVGVNYLIRKMASRSKPTSDITVDLQDETITITLNSTFMKKMSSFRLNEEYEEDFQGNKTKAIATFEDGKLTISNKPLSDTVKPTTAVREIIDTGDLLVTMQVGDVVCKRYWKRVT